MAHNKWPTVKLGEVVEVETSQVEPGEVAEDTSYVGLEHMRKGGGISKLVTVNEAQAEATKYIFKSTHVLFGKLRPNLGKVAVPPGDGICSTDILPLKPSPRIDQIYLSHYLLSKPARKWILNRVTGINLPRINKTALKQLPVPLPPLEEQRRIARVLGNCSKLHDQISGRKNLLESLFRSTTTSIFDNYSSTRKLEDFATVKTGPFGSMIHQSDYVSPGVPLINPQHIVNNKLSPSAEHQISSAKARTLEQYILRPGDIILGRRGQMGRAALVAMSDCPVICGTGCLIVRPHRIEDSVWLWAYLTGPLATQLLERAAIGATLPNLNSKIVSQLKVPSINSDLKSQIDQLHRTASRLLEKIDKSSVLTTELQSSLPARAFSAEL